MAFSYLGFSSSNKQKVSHHISEMTATTFSGFLFVDFYSNFKWVFMMDNLGIIRNKIKLFWLYFIVIVFTDMMNLRLLKELQL